MKRYFYTPWCCLLALFLSAAVTGCFLDEAGKTMTGNSETITYDSRSLASLTIREGNDGEESTVAISPVFSPNVTDYTVTLFEDYGSIEVTAECYDETATATAELYDYNAASDEPYSIKDENLALASGEAQDITLYLNDATDTPDTDIKNKLVITVTDSEAVSRDYTFYIKPRYTSINLDATWNTITSTALKTAIGNADSDWDDDSYAELAGSYEISGVITATDLYQKCGDKSFIIQDSETAVLIGSMDPIPFAIGDYVTVTLSNNDGTTLYANNIFNNYAAFPYDSIALIEESRSIYCNTTAYNNGLSGESGDSDLTLFKYTDADGLYKEADGFSTGYFSYTSSTNYYKFSTSSLLETLLEPEMKGVFYGPSLNGYKNQYNTLYIHNWDNVRLFDEQ
jgi:hypothetical protein